MSSKTFCVLLAVFMMGLGVSCGTSTEGGGIVVATDVGPAGPAGQNGQDGAMGPAGPAGQNGQDGAAGPQGDTGPQGPKGDTGETGPQGPQGDQGYTSLIFTGVADTSLCANGGTVINVGVDMNRDEVLDISEINNQAVVCNGVDGQNGQNGQDGHDGLNAPPTPLTPVSLLAPCAADPNSPTAQELSDPTLEVLIKMQSGTILTSFSENIEGRNTHFAVLSPGYYMSTGKGNCLFTLRADGVIVR